MIYQFIAMLLLTPPFIFAIGFLLSFLIGKIGEEIE